MSVVDEAVPRLVVRPRPRFWSPRFRRTFVPVAGSGALGLVLLVFSGTLMLPFTAAPTVEGRTGSKGELFEDAAMQRILMAHHLRVHITRTGSRELAANDLSGYDFAFPSGRPAANMVKQRLVAQGRSVQTRRPFTSPVVLASFRQYANALVAAGVATPQRNGLGGEPLYYTLRTRRFLDLIASGRTWDDLGIARYPDAAGHTLSNGNRVLAHSPSMCTSNSGETYLALLAYVQGGRNAPPTEREVAAVAEQIKPLLGVQGMQDADLFATYVTPEGKGRAPIVVVYEHQYLAYQSRRHQDSGATDGDRVLLYPEQEMLADPEFIPLTPEGERMGTLLVTDPGVRRRMMELGYRLVDSSTDTSNGQLWEFLADRGIPAPDRGGNLTKAELPVLPVLEELVERVGGC